MTYTMKSVYAKLSEMGLGKKTQIKKYLPSWWDESNTRTESGFQESLWLIANTFNIDFGSLVNSLSDSEEKPKFRLPTHQFKHSKNLGEQKLQPSVSISILTAKLTLSVFDKPLSDLSNLSAKSIRQNILDNGCQWIDFENLANYCWNIGIPVVFIPNPPSPKMDGLAFEMNNRPVIILTKKVKHGALVFDLAHELGHIILGHVKDNGMMFDKKIRKDNCDKLEEEATEFALELLTGKSDTKFKATQFYTPSKFADVVIAKAKKFKVDPFHIILNYGYNNSSHGLANQVVCKIVEKLGVATDDQDLAIKLYLNNIDIEQIEDEDIMYRILGIDFE